ncbi:MAG: FAD-dependent oxidoreductase [Aquabacterium sp.]
MDSKPNDRRRWLGGMSAAAVASLLPAGPEGLASAQTGTPTRGSYTTDVAVIGAGYAGLACARALVAAGRDVLVLEGRDRVGGRCFNQRLPAPYDQLMVAGGAEFLGPTQDRMYALAKEFGIATAPVYDTGKLVNVARGKRTTYTGVIPTANLLASADAGLALLKLDSLANEIPLDAPWTAAKAAEYDAMTVQGWIDKNVSTRDARNLLRTAVLALLCTEPAGISMLYFLFYVRSGGGLTSLLSTTGGAQQDHVVGGSQRIAIAMAQSLGAQRLLFNALARRITQDSTGVTILGDGFTVRANRVVVAMSPWVASRLDYSPMAGAMQARLQLMQRVPMGSVWKVHAVYDRPFWRDQGLNGQVSSDAFLTKVTFDVSPEGPDAPGIMMGFIEGQDAIDATLMTDAARKAKILEAFSFYFGSAAATPRAYVEMNWQAEALSAGGYTGVCPPGVMTGFGPVWRAPIGRLHWAGTETSPVWSGYMDGAVRSGERAAQEILGAA